MDHFTSCDTFCVEIVFLVFALDHEIYLTLYMSFKAATYKKGCERMLIDIQDFTPLHRVILLHGANIRLKVSQPAAFGIKTFDIIQGVIGIA